MSGLDRIVTLGEAMLRLTSPRGDRLGVAERFDSYPAGAEMNVAYALTRLGVPATWISALPDSPLGDRIARELAAAGVELSFVKRVRGGRLGLFFVEPGAPPRPTRVWYDRVGSAFAQMTAFDERALTNARYAVVSGITPGLGEAARALAARFVAAAHKAGARVCVDVNFRRLLWSPDEACRTLRSFLEVADLAVCSERDARTVFGLNGDEEQVLKNFARKWAPRAELVIVTRSERGSMFITQNEVGSQPALPTVVVDRFGVGDAFTAGVLWGLITDGRPAHAVRAGTALAALKCTIDGDLARFTRQELEAAIMSPAEVLVR